MSITSRRVAAAVALLALAGTASAHTGHGTHGFFSGLEHPLGADHLLAMIAVGVWSVFGLPARRAWQGPAAFMAALVASAALGASGVTLPFLEHAIALSVVVSGLMLVLATRRLPAAAGLVLVAVTASLHGLAHGGEAPGSASFAAYAAGFLLTTAALHVGGVVAGLSLRRAWAEHLPRALAGLGLACSGAGVLLLSRL
jgi:urease accessory protein